MLDKWEFKKNRKKKGEKKKRYRMTRGINKSF